MLKIDPTTDEVTILAEGSLPEGRWKWHGGLASLDGKFAYLFPCDAEYVLKFDMETDECQLVGPHLTEGENKFQNGFVGKDGCIYGCPQRASGVLRIIPPGVKRYDINGSLLPDGEEYIDVMCFGCTDKIMEGGRRLVRDVMWSVIADKFGGTTGRKKLDSTKQP